MATLKDALFGTTLLHHCCIRLQLYTAVVVINIIVIVVLVVVFFHCSKGSIAILLLTVLTVVVMVFIIPLILILVLFIVLIRITEAPAQPSVNNAFWVQLTFRIIVALHPFCEQLTPALLLTLLVLVLVLPFAKKSTILSCIIVHKLLVILLIHFCHWDIRGHAIDGELVASLLAELDAVVSKAGMIVSQKPPNTLNPYSIDHQILGIYRLACTADHNDGDLGRKPRDQLHKAQVVLPKVGHKAPVNTPSVAAKR
ncbi:hypothetical protein DFJ73DRAFT_950537 [Zopfochytrium polystomum]|nr:hypothetical protein DFJ73DRAFT_950537 [Zopfochytrium polystomum]